MASLRRSSFDVKGGKFTCVDDGVDLSTLICAMKRSENFEVTVTVPLSNFERKCFRTVM